MVKAKQNPNRQNQSNVGALIKRITELEVRVIKLEKGELADCSHCDEHGNQLDHRGNIARQDNNLPMLCQICNGTKKVRV